MSGGHWQYAGFRIKDEIGNIAEDESVQSRWPGTAAALANLADVLYEIEHEMDYDLSSDSAINDDAAFDFKATWAILNAVLKAAPDEWFPRGKWATIQAAQSRVAKESREGVA